MVSETRRPAVGGHEVRINCASWMNRATINYGTLFGGTNSFNPKHAQASFLPQGWVGMSIWTQKTKPQVNTHSALLEGKCQQLNKKAQYRTTAGTFILKLMQLGSLSNRTNWRTRSAMLWCNQKYKDWCKSDHLCCVSRALKQKHLQGGCPFYTKKIVKKSRCLHMLHMFSYKTIAYRNCFNIVQCQIQRTPLRC